MFCLQLNVVFDYGGGLAGGAKRLIFGISVKGIDNRESSYRSFFHFT